MRILAIALVGTALLVVAPHARAQVSTILFDNVAAVPPGHIPMSGGYLYPTSQNFQEDGNHIEVFWVPNDETSFVQGHFHHVERNFEGSHGFASAAGLGPDVQGPYVRRVDGGQFDLLGLDYRNLHQFATHLYFAGDLVPLPSLAPFTPVPVSPGSHWQTVVLDQFQDLDQVFMTANLGTSASHQLQWDTIRIGIADDLVEDAFDGVPLSGGTGWMDDNWTTSGLVSQGSIGLSGPQRTVVRIKNTGSMRRVASMVGVINPRLHVDMMILNYEGDDTASLQVSGDGVNFTTLREFTAEDSDGIFYEYKFDLGFLSSAAFIEIALVTNATAPVRDYCFIDSLRLRGVDDGGSAPVADAGADQIVEGIAASGSVDVQLDGTGSFDPDGTVVSYEWVEGQTLLGTSEVITVNLPYGEHLVTLTVEDDTGLISTDDVTIRCSPGSIAFDGFESGSWNGGSGDWLGPWTTAGLTSTGGSASSNPGLMTRIRDTGSISRSADLSFVSFPRLSFRYMVADYELGDVAWVEVSPDGVNFTQLHEITSSVSDRSWRSLDLDLSGVALTSDFVIRLRTDTQLTNARDYIHVDDFQVFGARL